MSDALESPSDPRQQRFKEYEDPHFHNDDEVEPIGEEQRHGHHPPHGKQPKRRPLPRRRHYED
jgi:hypothetical protein